MSVRTPTKDEANARVARSDKSIPTAADRQALIVGLKVSLENQVADETRHKEEIERVLAGRDER